MRRLAGRNQSIILFLAGLLAWSGGLVPPSGAAGDLTRRILAPTEVAPRRSIEPSFTSTLDTPRPPCPHVSRFAAADVDDDLDLPETDLGEPWPTAWEYGDPGRAGPGGPSASSPTRLGPPPRPGRLRC